MARTNQDLASDVCQKFTPHSIQSENNIGKKKPHLRCAGLPLAQQAGHSFGARCDFCGDGCLGCGLEVWCL